MAPIFEPLIIMLLVLLEVALWQWRVAITLRGELLRGVLLGVGGAIIQVTVLSRVVQNIGDITRVSGYAAGVGAGVLLGCLIDRRVSSAHVIVRVFAPVEDEGLVLPLRAAGWPVTATRGEGHEGPVDILMVAIDHRRVASLEQVLTALSPRACWTVERIASSSGLLDGAELRVVG